MLHIPIWKLNADFLTASVCSVLCDIIDEKTDHLLLLLLSKAATYYILITSIGNLMKIVSLSVFVVLSDKIDVKTGHWLSVCFCLQAASDFYFVAAICMICLVETLGGTFASNLFLAG